MLEQTLYTTAYMCTFTNEITYFLSGDKDGFVTDDGMIYVTVGSHELSFPEPSLTIEEYNTLAIELLNKSKDKVEAEAYVKVQIIEDKIQSFLALPAPIEDGIS